MEKTKKYVICVLFVIIGVFVSETIGGKEGNPHFDSTRVSGDATCTQDTLELSLAKGKIFRKYVYGHRMVKLSDLPRG
ncbi:MAG: hypothetical protein GVX96_06945 [Bacteroidetes bacterium]|nr:hypothetical protein [Bacteroidota bacterium]